MSELMEEIDLIWAQSSQNELGGNLRSFMERMEREYGRVSAEFATAANELGTWGRVTAHYGEGEDAFKEALDSMEALVGRDDRWATCLDNLAELYRLRGDLDRCQEALDVAEATFSDKDSLEYAACLNYKGHLAESRGDASAARDLYMRSLAIVKRREPGSVSLATGYQNVANALMACGDAEAASDYLHRAIALYDDKTLPVNAHYVSLLNQVAALYVQLGNLKAAERFYDAALEALPKTIVSPIDAVVVLGNAAGCYRASGKIDKLARVAAQVESIATKSPVASHPLVQRIADHVHAL